MAKMRFPSWYGLATEGGDGEVICWWVSCNRWVIASTYSEGHQRPGMRERPVAHQEGGLVPVLWRSLMRRTREVREAWH